MDRKEEWISEVMGSLDGMKKAEPNPDLFAKITSNLPVVHQAELIPLRQLRWVAAAACLVVGVNIFVFSLYISSYENAKPQSTTKHQLNNEYSLYK